MANTIEAMVLYSDKAVAVLEKSKKALARDYSFCYYILVAVLRWNF